MQILFVIHDEFGGLSLTTDMVTRLKKRKCEWADRCVQVNQGNWYPPFQIDVHSFRTDSDFVAVIQELTQEYETEIGVRSLTWQERRYLREKMLNNLKVVEVTVEIEIVNHDGKETVRVCGGVW